MRNSIKQTLTALVLSTTLSTGFAGRALAQGPGAFAPVPAADSSNMPPSVVEGNPAPATATLAPRLSAYAAGDTVASLAVALGGINGSMGDTEVPPLVAAVDYGVHPDVSVGGLVSYYRSSVSYGYAGLSGAKWTYNYLTIGARSDYHFGRFVGVEKLDLYGGAILAYNIVSVSSPSSSTYASLNTASASVITWGLNVGARYFFTPSLAAQAELGVGLGNLSAGIAYKF
jgi:hypothetical protein